MTLQIELSPTMEAELTAAARRQGIEPSAYALQKLSEALNSISTRKPLPTVSEAENFLAEMSQFSDKLPAYPGETFDRAFLYGEHD